MHSKEKERRFTRKLYIAMGFCFVIFLTDRIAFDYTEFTLVSRLIRDKFTLPIAIVVLILWLYAFTRVYIPFGKSKYILLTILYKTTSTLSMSFVSFYIVLFTLTYSTVILNAALGDGRTISLNAKVIGFEVVKTSARYGVPPIVWYVQVKDPELNRQIRVSVNKRYLVGDEFHGTFSVGKWGWLYSK